MFDPFIFLLGGSCGRVASVGATTSVGGLLLSREARFSGEDVSAFVEAIDRLGGGRVGGVFDFEGIRTSRGFEFGLMVIGELRAAGFFGTGGAGLRLRDVEDWIGTDFVEDGDPERPVNVRSV